MILLITIFCVISNETALSAKKFMRWKAKNASEGAFGWIGMGPLVKFHQNFDYTNDKPLERAVKVLQNDTTTTS